jgi:hypothetical protein
MSQPSDDRSLEFAGKISDFTRTLGVASLNDNTDLCRALIMNATAALMLRNGFSIDDCMELQQILLTTMVLFAVDKKRNQAKEKADNPGQDMADKLLNEVLEKVKLLDQKNKP